ncbi:class I SAM-dependent methyltransferase [Candidatus Dependentiae bacterium]|nr:class I SAM-dependent methyltransferase [Candidatus Dependentiae bacterium]
MMVNDKIPDFYEQYFDKNSYEMFKYDVGSYCTKRAIEQKIVLKQGSALEIGIGITSLLENLQAFDCYGIDIAQKTIDAAKTLFQSKGLQATLLQACATQLPFTNNSFDLVVSSHVFEHIEQDEKALQEVARVLKKNGLFIMFVPGSLNGKASTEEWEKCRHYRNYNLAQIKRLEQASNGLLILSTISYEHKVHNLIWNKLKNVFRWANYPIKKWILRDNKTFESRKTYQRFLLPAIAYALDNADNLVKRKESYLLGVKFNVLAVFKKVT